MEGKCETGCRVNKEQKEEEDREGKNPPQMRGWGHMQEREAEKRKDPW